MVSQGFAISPTRFEFALVLFVAIAPILLCDSSQMTWTATLTARAPLSTSRVADTYSKLPLSFEINQGQADPRVKFLSRGSGYSLFLTNTEAILTLRKSGPVSRAKTSFETVSFKPQSRLAKTAPVADSVVRMRLVGANLNAEVGGLDELPGKSNYFIGNDPKNWRTNVPNYARVKYANVYPGVDLVYYGNQRELEYDLVLAPGADPQRIQLSFDGASRLRLDADGDLIVSIAGGKIIEHKPVVYQDIDGIRHEVTGGYQIGNGQTVGFKLTQYDRRHALIIDPALVYSTYLGGSGADFGFGIAVDSYGDAYVTGLAASIDFPTTAGAFQTTQNGRNYNAFVSKLKSSGSSLIYSTYLGGSNADEGIGIAADSSGNAYVTGYAASSDFPTTPNAFQANTDGAEDGFVTKLNPSGSQLLYSTYLGGSHFDYGASIALDSSGNAYVTGSTQSSDFPTTPGAFQTSLAGGEDAFVTKLNANGSGLVYSTYLGGTHSFQPGLGIFQAGLGIAVDFVGSAYVIGGTNAPDFPTTPGAYRTSWAEDLGCFVTKLNLDGSALSYSTYIYACNAIAVDSLGDAYITGSTLSTNVPTTPGAFQTSLAGRANALVMKLNPSGNGLVYSTYLGGNSSDQGFSIAVESQGDAYITGSTSSTNFPTTPGAFQTSLAGGEEDAFVTKLNPNGSQLVYSTYLGGSNSDTGASIALDSSQNAYIAGWTMSDNFPVTSGAFQSTNGGPSNAFITKLALAPFAGRPGAPNCYGQSVSALSNQYGGLNAAARALGFPGVQALQTAIRAFCAG